jgi:hypothetical protein
MGGVVIPILYEDALNEPHPKPLPVYREGLMIKRNFTENWYKCDRISLVSVCLWRAIDLF